MRYIKITDGEGFRLEVLPSPGYVRWQERNGMPVRCTETQAHGVLSADGSVIYQLEGRLALPLEGLKTARFIPETEYEALLTQAKDPEDETPEVPEDTEEAEILTRAQLTAKVSELEEALELILSGVTE